MSSNHEMERLLRQLSAPRLNHYYYGKLMDEAHFKMEQDYERHHRWLFNRLTLGYGVLCGLNVSIVDEKLCVAPGVAIDRLGREIVVPLSTCVDPWAIGESCCSETGTIHQANVPEQRSGPATLWLCYRECLTDYAPVLVSDCDTREDCKPGTIVETFQLCLRPGLPPETGKDRDEWCKSWMQPHSDATFSHKPKDPSQVLCEILDNNCDSSEGDICVPLAVVELQSGKKLGKPEICRYRPSVYSNAMLLELIICLFKRVEECCNHKNEPEPEKPVEPEQKPELLKVVKVEALDSEGGVKGALDKKNLGSNETWKIAKSNNDIYSLRITFNRPVDPKTVIGDHKRHTTNHAKYSFLVESANSVIWGSIKLADSNKVVEFVSEKPLNAYKDIKVTLFGNSDATGVRYAIQTPQESPDTASTLLDGEPSNLPSGDDSEGGNFVFRIKFTE